MSPRVPYCVPSGPYFPPRLPCATHPRRTPHPGRMYPSSFHRVFSSCVPSLPPPPQILGLVAKGSFGTILKVLDCGREKVCAVKVSAAPQPGGSVLPQKPPPS